MTFNTQKNCLLHANWLKEHYFTFFFNLQVRWWKKLTLASIQRLPRSVKDGFGQPTLPCFLWSPKVSKFSLSFHQSWKHVIFFLIIVFKKCVWGLNWHFGNVWSFTSHFAYWSVNCNYHNILQETMIFLQKEPIFAVYTVALFPY